MNYLLKQNASFLPPFYRYTFDKDSLCYLCQSYSIFLPDLKPSDVPNLYDSYSTVTIWGDQIGSDKSKLERCKYVTASWVRTDGNIAKTTNDIRPGIVKYFFLQKIKIKGEFMLLQW